MLLSPVEACGFLLDTPVVEFDCDNPPNCADSFCDLGPSSDDMGAADAAAVNPIVAKQAAPTMCGQDLRMIDQVSASTPIE